MKKFYNPVYVVGAVTVGVAKVNPAPRLSKLMGQKPIIGYWIYRAYTQLRNSAELDAKTKASIDTCSLLLYPHSVSFPEASALLLGKG